MAKKKEETAESIAVKLMDARNAINEWKAIEKPLADALKARIKAGEQQDSFKLTTSATFKVDDVKTALKWAEQYAPDVITVDATAARKVFLADTATGSMGTAEKNGFVFAETEKLVAISGKEE